MTSARDRFESGDRRGALRAIDEALAIDPQFLAALSLRDRIASSSSSRSADPPRSAPYAPMASAVPLETPLLSPNAPLLDALPIVAPPHVSSEALFDLPLAPVDRGFGISQPIPDIAAALADAVPAASAPAAAAVGIGPASLASPPNPGSQSAGAVPVSGDAPLVSKEGYARFEQRAKRRRVDRRLDAARAALDSGRVKEAAVALDEVLELDPNLPELKELTARYDNLRRNTARRSTHPGRWLAAAAAFGAIVLGASWLQDGGGLWSRPLIGVAPLIAPPQSFGSQAAAIEPDIIADIAVPTSGDEPREEIPAEAPRSAALRNATERLIDMRPPDAAVASPAASRPPAPPAPQQAASVQGVPEADELVVPIGGTTTPLPPAAPAVSTASAAVTPAAAPVVPAVATAPPPAAPAPAAVPAVNDELLVNQVLQRYRTAYEGLDARSARVVWPAVNENALARAFDGLESQKLTFDECDVRLRGEAAAATCHGSAKYVPKVGNHEPRVEPRTWTFTLRKNGADWKIESARTER